MRTTPSLCLIVEGALRRARCAGPDGHAVAVRASMRTRWSSRSGKRMRKKNDPTGKPPKSQAETRRERLEARRRQYSVGGKRVIATAWVLGPRLPTCDLRWAQDA